MYMKKNENEMNILSFEPPIIILEAFKAFIIFLFIIYFSLFYFIYLSAPFRHTPARQKFYPRHLVG